jgi:hypothetical protein
MVARTITADRNSLQSLMQQRADEMKQQTKPL